MQDLVDQPICFPFIPISGLAKHHFGLRHRPRSLYGYSAKITTEAWLEEGARRWIERLTRRAQHLVDDRRHLVHR
jgi:hypothetical protein